VFLKKFNAGPKGLVGLGIARVSNPSIFPNNLGSDSELTYRTHRKTFVNSKDTHTL